MNNIMEMLQENFPYISIFLIYFFHIFLFFFLAKMKINNLFFIFGRIYHLAYNKRVMSEDTHPTIFFFQYFPMRKQCIKNQMTLKIYIFRWWKIFLTIQKKNHRNPILPWQQIFLLITLLLRIFLITI